MRYLPLLLLLTSCASFEAHSLLCLGLCLQTEVKKGESPVKPEEVMKEIK